MKKLINSEKWKKIRLLILDVDGVLTDGIIKINSDGTEGRNFSALDGIGIHAVRRIGIDVAVISARKSKVTEIRANELGIDYIYMGEKDKINTYKELMSTLNIDTEKICYIGDDEIDLPLIRVSGIGVAVKNALDIVKAEADFITSRRGGAGAVREVCDFILKSNDTSIEQIFCSVF